MWNHDLLPNRYEMFSEPSRGEVIEAIALNRNGRIKYQGTYWTGMLYQPRPTWILQPKDSVFVIAIQGISLVVIPTDCPSEK